MGEGAEVGEDASAPMQARCGRKRRACNGPWPLSLSFSFGAMLRPTPSFPDGSVELVERRQMGSRRRAHLRIARAVGLTATGQLGSAVLRRNRLRRALSQVRFGKAISTTSCDAMERVASHRVETQCVCARRTGYSAHGAGCSTSTQPHKVTSWTDAPIKCSTVFTVKKGSHFI